MSKNGQKLQFETSITIQSFDPTQSSKGFGLEDKEEGQTFKKNFHVNYRELIINLKTDSSAKRQEGILGVIFVTC